MVWEIYKNVCMVVVTGIIGASVIFELLISLICLIDTVKENVLAKKEKEN